MGDIASELLATAIAQRRHVTAAPIRLQWISRPLGALVDLDDKDALFSALDETHAKSGRS